MMTTRQQPPSSSSSSSYPITLTNQGIMSMTTTTSTNFYSDNKIKRRYPHCTTRTNTISTAIHRTKGCDIQKNDLSIRPFFSPPLRQQDPPRAVATETATAAETAAARTFFQQRSSCPPYNYYGNTGRDSSSSGSTSSHSSSSFDVSFPPTSSASTASATTFCARTTATNCNGKNGDMNNGSATTMTMTVTTSVPKFFFSKQRFMTLFAVVLVSLVAAMTNVWLNNNNNNSNNNKMKVTGAHNDDIPMPEQQQKRHRNSILMAPTNHRPEPPPTSLLRSGSTQLRQRLISILLENDITTQERIQDRTSPAHKALNWLIETTMTMTMANSKHKHYGSSSSSAVIADTITEHQIITRFALATLYFATTPSSEISYATSNSSSNNDQESEQEKEEQENKEGWTNRDNWLVVDDEKNIDYCNWYGISCAHKIMMQQQQQQDKENHNNNNDIMEQVVNKISLNGNHLVGTIPDELFYGLRYDLTHLNLSHNYLCGPLPSYAVVYPFAGNDHISKKKKTKKNMNQQSSPAPSSLRKLILNDNEFTDGIPQSLLFMANLRVLNV